MPSHSIRRGQDHEGGVPRRSLLGMLAIALLLAFLVAAPVSAASARPGATTAATTAATTHCYYAYWIAQATGPIGNVLFQYKEQVNWCAASGKITSASRTTTPITPVPSSWQYQSETLFGPDYNAAHSNVNYTARGLFNHVLPTPFGYIVIGQSHPMVSITVNANGTASGNISW